MAFQPAFHTLSERLIIRERLAVHQNENAGFFLAAQGRSPVIANKAADGNRSFYIRDGLFH